VEREGQPIFEVAIVGGGPAGLSAALVLGRMRRRVVVLDADAPENAVSDGVGGLLSRDRIPPAELRAVSREQITGYPSVEFRIAHVIGARRHKGAFEVDAGGGALSARKLLLAHGLEYARPEIEGIEEIWGDRAFHCPYCHGWEVRDRAVVVLATNAKAARQALLLRSLTDDVMVAGDPEGLGDEERELLSRAGIDHVAVAPLRVAGESEGVRIELEGGDALRCDAVFIQPSLALACDLANDLSAELADDGTIAAGAGGATSVPGLHVAGDAGPPPQSVALAIGSGASAAYAIHADLAYEDVGAG
jgi:thioredoxin reductase